MKKFMVVAMMIAAASLVATNASAQSDHNWVQVTATVVGVFDFQIDTFDYPDSTAPATFGFGEVSVAGAVDPLKVGSVVGTPDGSGTFATYVAAAAFDWTVASAPRRPVDITINDAGVAGPLAMNQLRLRMNSPSGSTGYTAVAAGATLVSGVSAGNGDNKASGTIDLELTVDDSDAEGSAEYLIQLMATGL